MSLPDGLLCAWYGDDFTGSAATMEALSFAGLPSVLFLDIPTPARRAAFAGIRGLGIAGTARAHSPEWMDRELPPIFRYLAGLDAPVSTYKVCSTLDSAPHVGSIGKAIDLAAQAFRPGWIPLLLAAPPIRRYQAFGSLFAAAPGGVFRLDRHPVMARHPVTPMHEADVRLHLAQQTARTFGLVDLEQLQSDATADAALTAQLAAGAAIMALDTVDTRTLSAAGRLIWENRQDIAFAVGSQGVQYALVQYWREIGLIPDIPEPCGAGRAERIVVVSGSVSPVTAAQIDWSLAHGFQGIPFDTTAAARDPAALDAAIDHAVRAALAALDAGADPLIFTARGPDDPSVSAFRAALAHGGVAAEEANLRVGAALGTILDRVMRRARLTRGVISGGDTSGNAARQLGIFALTALSPTIPGAALLKAHSDDPAHADLQLALKGGQMGSADYFGWIKDGGGARAK